MSEINKIKKWKQFLNENKSDVISKIDSWFESHYNARYIKMKYPFNIGVRNPECIYKIKDKYNIEVVEMVNPRVSQSIIYHIFIENWRNVTELKEILLECYNDSVEYGFISKEQIDSYKNISFERLKKLLHDSNN
jgi:hypothetical protein